VNDKNKTRTQDLYFDTILIHQLSQKFKLIGKD